MTPEVIKSEHGFLREIINRRARTLALSAIMATSAGALPQTVSAEEDQPKTAVELIVPQNPVEQAAQSLDSMIRLESGTDLTIAESRRMVSATATLFHEMYDTTFTPEDFVDRTFIVSSEFTPEDEKLMKEKGWFFTLDPEAFRESSFYDRLKSTYPDNPRIESLSGNAIFTVMRSLYQLQFLDNLTNAVISSNSNQSQLERLLGVTISQEGVIFVFNNATNNLDGWSFDELSNPECKTTNPAITKAVTDSHEFAHLAPYAHLENGEFLELNSIMLNGTGVFYEDGNPADSGVFGGFYMKLFKTDAEGNKVNKDLIGLEEFVAHYLASKLMTENGLETISIGVKTPQAMENFGRMLEQSGISLGELAKLHELSQPEELLSRIAKGAKGFEFSSREEEVKFTMGTLLPKLIKDEPMWEKDAAPYFNLDLSGYEKLPEQPKDLPSGCMVLNS